MKVGERGGSTKNSFKCALSTARTPPISPGMKQSKKSRVSRVSPAVVPKRAPRRRGLPALLNAHLQTDAPTLQMNAAAQRAFDFFNRELWGDSLPHIMLLFHRNPRSRGYFHAGRWIGPDGARIPELALNPDLIRAALGDAPTRTDVKRVLSTLVHEMCHYWEYVRGTQSARGYHNAIWAGEMRRVGLSPYNVKDPSKETGFSVSHTIVPGGAFDLAADKLLASGFSFDWSSFPLETGRKKGAKSGKRIKYVCDCSAVWGKGGIEATCDLCGEPFRPAD